jgi:hypothetical protein
MSTNDNNVNPSYHLRHVGTIRYEANGKSYLSNYHHSKWYLSTYVLLPVSITILLVICRILHLI